MMRPGTALAIGEEPAEVCLGGQFQRVDVERFPGLVQVDPVCGRDHRHHVVAVGLEDGCDALAGLVGLYLDIDRIEVNDAAVFALCALAEKDLVQHHALREQPAEWFV